MQSSQWEVIVLKPTPVFQSFLAAQNITHIPALKELHVDNAAFVIRKQASEEATLDEIERHFAKMFHVEASRWLGSQVDHPLMGSFLDFLCCFKFEMHEHIVLMESAMEIGQQLIRIKPRSVLLKWMRQTVEDDTELTTVLNQVNVTQLGENSTVIVKNFHQLDLIRPFLETFYQPIFEAEMSRMSDSPKNWPTIRSFGDFIRYFSVEIHTNLIHLH